jgi:hypothetical protein
MKFKDLVKLIEENGSSSDAFKKTGDSFRKERMTSSAGDQRARDAARKRAERSRQVPRSRKSKEELIKEVIAVKTKSGRVQLIFKDSFNKDYHTRISKDDNLSIEEARTITGDPEFEQTGASKLLFGNVKGKKESEKEEGGRKEISDKQKKEPTEKEEKKSDTISPPKPKRLSKEEIFQVMTQMTPEQLSQMPPEVRAEYFKLTRNPPSNVNFDNLSFEALSNKFGIDTLSSAPYNQQVINALIFLAKIKAGAGEQELASYSALATGALDFTKNAFLQAKKILSQIGDECIQNLVSSIENGTKTTFSEGDVDMECGNYRFKVAAGGEFLLTTNRFDQNSKTFRGLVAGAIAKSIQDPNSLNDPKVKEFQDSIKKSGSKFSKFLLSKQSMGIINQNPDLKSQLQQIVLQDENGANIGTVIDENGNLNKLASLEEYQKEITKSAPLLFKNNKNSNSQFVDIFVRNILKSFYRGDGLKSEETSPTHVVTQNGIFELNDGYFEEISKTATIKIKPASTILGTDNLISSDKKSLETMKKFTSVVEAVEEQKKPSIKDLFLDKNSINPLQLALYYISNNMDFDINASLLPGFSPKDLNVIEYNYVRIGNKTIKIPVERTDKFLENVSENYNLIVNDLIVESLSNNFVLSNLLKTSILNYEEANTLINPSLLLENDNNIQKIYENALNRIYDNPKLLVMALNGINSELYEKYVRDYKKEYRNYHGKPKQRKDRSKRTTVREKFIKKGIIKKGSKKDIDHKVPLRNGGSNKLNNLRLRDRSENRSDNGHSKGEKQNKDWK